MIGVSCDFSSAVPEPVIPVTGTPKVTLIHEDFDGEPVVIAGSNNRNFAVAFQCELNGSVLRFDSTASRFPIIMKDESGSEWNVWGKAVNGPLEGAQLTPVNAGAGYWFVFSASYPGVEIYSEGGTSVDMDWDTLPGWGIPAGGVAQGADFNEIDALDNPNFIQYHPFEISPDEGFYLNDDDLVVIVNINDEIKVYPHAILDWHEVINDVIGGVPVSITYSPLTATTKVWERDSIKFGVSGLIYNNNMLAFDRFTESFWWQLEGRCIFGGLNGQQLKLRHYLETTWGEWKKVESSPYVVSDEQGNGLGYGTFPYGDYPTNSHITYPLLFEDNRLPQKERVFGILKNGQCKVYRMNGF
ncbi:MAG: DUF3179 domain-containing protein [Phaeodactylibacter sp.]|nr:DUF3179 domain-containing protein [Phaeodactylibacter sp.]